MTTVRAQFESTVVPIEKPLTLVPCGLLLVLVQYLNDASGNAQQFIISAGSYARKYTVKNTHRRRVASCWICDTTESIVHCSGILQSVSGGLAILQMWMSGRRLPVRSNTCEPLHSVGPTTFPNRCPLSRLSLRVYSKLHAKHQNVHTKSVAMHSTLTRAQNVFGYFTTVASVVAVIIALSAFSIPQRPTANLKLRNIQVYV